MMLSQIEIRHAIDVVLGWNLSDVSFGEAVIAEAMRSGRTSSSTTNESRQTQKCLAPGLAARTA